MVEDLNMLNIFYFATKLNQYVSHWNVLRTFCERSAFHMQFRICHMWGSTIFGSRRLIKAIPRLYAINMIRQLPKLSLNICIFKQLLVNLFISITLQSVNRDKRSINHAVPRFSSNSEANASESLNNFEEIFPHYLQ